MSTAEDYVLDALFPLPSPPPVFAPRRLHGVSHESSAMISNLLKENYIRWHILFNDEGFHKYVPCLQIAGLTHVADSSHAAHMSLAIYQLGGSAAVIEEAYKLEAAYQRDASPSPTAITDDNFEDHLRDRE